MTRALGIALCALLLCACFERPRTQVMVIVDADTIVRAQASSLDVEIRGRASGETFQSVATHTFTLVETGWPVEVAVLPAGGDSMRQWLAIATARDASGTTIVEQRAYSGFVADQTVSHTIFLDSDCSGVSCTGEEQTCQGGSCRAAYVPPAALRPYVRDAGAPMDGGSESGQDAGCLPGTPNVDVLLMVDNSVSMDQEQDALARTLPRLVEALASGDANGDGVVDFVPIDSLQIGIVSSDLGSAGYTLASCGSGTLGFEFGDDGLLQTRGNMALDPTCLASYPSVFTFTRGTDMPATFAHDVACVARLGTTGCGFEQQLQSALKAVAPASPTAWTGAGYEPIVFHGGTPGHGDRENAALFRDNSVLAIILISDEDDCSVLEETLFDPNNTTYTSQLTLRCSSHPETLHPTSRFVDGLRLMRRDPRRLVLASIIGIPVDVDPGLSEPDYAAILAHPLMIVEPDPANPGMLRPSCNTTGLGLAFPPNRIVQTARDLSAIGPAVTVHSICQPDYQLPIQRIAQLIGERVAGSCP